MKNSSQGGEKTSEAINIHALQGLQAKAVWTLDQLTNSKKDRFPATVIANFLIEECRINTSRQAVTYALDKVTKVCNKNKNGYKLMEYGRQLLLRQPGERIILIESNKPFSAKNVALKKIFSKFSGKVKICDPYIDINTLDIIFKYLDKKLPLQILTANVADKPTGTFTRHLKELAQEGFTIEIRKYGKSVLHDRYITDDRSFWLSGNSLNYLGKKESFLVVLGKDIHQSMNSTFNRRWKVAIPV